MSDWTLPPAAPSLEWEHISTQLFGSAAAAVVFSGFDTRYRRFMLHWYTVTAITGSRQVDIVLNNDTVGGTYQVQIVALDMTSGLAVSTTGLGSVVAAGRIVLDAADGAGYSMGGWIFIGKPAAGVQARFNSRSVVRRNESSLVISGLAVDGVWRNTVSLISRIEIRTGISSSARFMLSGARESL